MEVFGPFYGLFTGSFTTLWTVGFTLLFLYMGYKGSKLIFWSVALAVAMIGFGTSTFLFFPFVGLALVFNVPFLRRLISRPIMSFVKAQGLIPKVSDTERAALDAGVVWIEKDLFSGSPNFNEMKKDTFSKLSDEEQAFLDGPVEELCKMVDDWKIWKERDLGEEVWNFLKKEKFFGLIVPKQYGGLEFSALGNSAIITKISSRSIPTGITTMVPNSLGPAELLIHYGTEKQKDRYLPTLANGEDIPCFALTEPEAGSDASSIQSEGVLFKGEDGKLYIRLNWNKRWITLAGIATIIGLAFRLRDPDNLLGRGEDLGITCGLVPSQTPGVDIGSRHDPIQVPFYNCPTRGRDVVVPAEDTIIGGIARAGEGWNMLMESLAAGRGISLPAQSAATAKLSSRLVGAHATVRRQFGMSIGKFEGVSEVLARIGGFTYAIDSMRQLTAGALNHGIKPPVVTAMTKYYSTELARKIVIDGMDILGGAGISLGPRNIYAPHYIAGPIAITVEGANILTRTLMIYGQGAFRAHLYAYDEIKALEANDLVGFDKALWGHIGHVFKTGIRAVLLSLSRGRLYRDCPSTNRRYYQKLAWASASFAVTSDIAMMTLGPKLKVRESITGRFADILAWNYIGFATLARFEKDGSPKEDLPMVEYALKHASWQIQSAFNGIYDNLNIPGLGWFFKGIVGAWSRINSLGDDIPDELSHQVADLMLKPNATRDRLTEGMFTSDDTKDPLGRVEYAFKLAAQASDAERKIKKAIASGKLPKKKLKFLIDAAAEASVVTADEVRALKLATDARLDAIQVDEFTDEEFRGATHSNEESLT